MTTKPLALLTIAAIAALSLAACTSGGGSDASATRQSTAPDEASTSAQAATDDSSDQEASPASNATGTFTYAISSDPTSLNPINTGDRWGLTFANIVFEPLARIDATTGATELVLAESVTPADDGLSITVTLKDGLVWSDGETITADDVVFTYTAKAVKENGNADLLWIQDQPITATAVDAKTVRFDLPAYSAAAVSNVATETFIIPEHVYGDITDFSGSELETYLGSGPYVLDEYKRGEYLSFTANPLYAGGTPNIENLVLRIVADPDTVKAALQTGEIDGSHIVPSQVADLAGSPVSSIPYPEGRVAYLGVVVPRVEDAALRQALFFALDREEISKAAWLDPANYELAYTILPPGNPYATTDVEKYEQDADKATALLAEAGLASPTLRLGYAGSDLQQQAEAAVIQAQAAQVGIAVELVSLDGGAVYEEIEKGKDSSIDLWLGGYIMGIDPDAYSLLFRSGASANYFTYSNPAVDQLFDDGVAAPSDAGRQAVYTKLQQTVADDAVFYAIADNLKILAISDRIGGIDQAKLASIYTFENWGELTQ
jgi:peptide/nickel transport system substrate-binding protein